LLFAIPSGQQATTFVNDRNLAGLKLGNSGSNKVLNGDNLFGFKFATGHFDCNRGAGFLCFTRKHLAFRQYKVNTSLLNGLN